MVDLENRTCACKRWQLIGLPCVHAMSVLLTQHEYPFDFVDDCYKREAYLKAYSPVIYGLNGPAMWPKTNQLPIQCLEFKKQYGRSRKSRVLQSDEVRHGGRTKLRKNYSVCHCSNCGEQGHNLRSCKQPQCSTSTSNEKEEETNKATPQVTDADRLVDVAVQSTATDMQSCTTA